MTARPCSHSMFDIKRLNKIKVYCGTDFKGFTITDKYHLTISNIAYCMKLHSTIKETKKITYESPR